ncbi:uncharacterized protein FIESC28_00884 [Fusarium coffeatum]|uniref:Uncharacterized protein n=1 Tax=Fusarium coffeatum TaxID=231269 RepID=A0A366SAC8_9HYPO|nr:uncharacterized protein FIESC28_00884 [Fusarium coffeatum]RBR26239.1 hypothetical protein FIESC28_00884 [Fusarium coffeatum]
MSTAAHTNTNTNTCNKSRTINTIPDGATEFAAGLTPTQICHSYCDPSITFGKQFAAALDFEPKRAALVKLFQFLGCSLIQLTEETATFIFAGKDTPPNMTKLV